MWSRDEYAQCLLCWGGRRQARLRATTGWFRQCRNRAGAVGKQTCSAIGVHGFGCWASVQLSLLSDSNSCSTSAELCITVGRGESETGVVISQPDHSHKLRSYTTQQTTINCVTVQRQNSAGFLGQNGLLFLSLFLFLNGSFFLKE